MNPENTLQLDEYTRWISIDELPVAYTEMDREGRVVRLNRRACQLFDVTEEQIVGKKPWDAMPGREGELNRDAFLALMQTGQAPPIVRRVLFTSTGAFRTYEVHRSTIFDDQKRPSGMRSVMFDVTEAELTQEELHKSRMWLTSIMASIDEAVVVTDSLGFVRYINPAAEILLGWKSEEFLGMLIEKGLPVLSYCSVDNVPLNFHNMMESGWKGTATLLDRHRHELQVEINAAPILDAQNGYTLGVVRTMRKCMAVATPV